MNWLSMFDPATSSRLCLTLLHSVWQVSLLAGAAWAMERLLRRRSVERSYAVHVAALGLSLALLPATYVFVEAPGSQPTAASVLAAKGSAPQAPRGELVATPAAAESASLALAGEAASNQLNRWPPARSAMRETLQNLSPWLAGLYMAGVAAMLARLVRSVVASERLRRRATPIAAGPLAEMLGRLAKAWSLSATPALATAAGLATPKVIGLIRPMILLPASALAGMPASELELILVHELAHIRRHDMWINLGQRLAEAVLFFNPGLWYLSRRIGTLREYCCDEFTCGEAPAVAAAGRLDYARALLRVVEISLPGADASARSELAALAAAGRSPSELRRRVSRLLGEPLREPAPLTRGGFSLLAAATLLLAFGPTLLVHRGVQADEPKAAEKDALPGIEHTVSEKLSSGARVEVLALGKHGEGPQPWWDAAGKPIERVPFTWKEAGKVTAPESVWRRIVFRIHDLPKDASVTWSVRGATSSAGGEVALDGKKLGEAQGYFTRYFSVPDDAADVSLRVGVASGAWRTVVKTGGHSLATSVLGKSIVFSEALSTEEGVVVVVSHDFFDEAYRVVAIDKEGKTHTSSYQGGMSAGRIAQTRPTFAGLTMEEIDRFEFQVRGYEWVEFKGLPLVAENEKRADVHTLTIEVVDAAGKPIEGARVRQNHVHALSAGGRHLIKNHNYTTDAQGKAVVTWPGKSIDLRLWVTKAGYVPLHAMWAKKFQADGDEIPEEFRFQMAAGTEIGGIVTDEQGRPVAGARVEIMNALAGWPTPVDQLGERPSRAIWPAEGKSAPVTDAHGRWTASNIPPDEALKLEDYPLAEQFRLGARARRDLSTRLSAPLLLKVSHPRFETFNGWENPSQATNPELEALRNKEATVTLRRAAE